MTEKKRGAVDLLALPTHKMRLEALREAIKPFKQRAAAHDYTGQYPYENYQLLRAINLPALTIPKQYGGGGISLCEMLELQAEIAKVDASTALSIGWHLGISKSLGESGAWDESLYAELAEAVVTEGALINNAASEPATGSPTRGGKPETVALKTKSGWRISGRKTFTTLAPVLDYFAVSASIEESDKVGSFLIKRTLPGVSIEETWDSIAMSASGSHDLILDGVEVRPEDLAQYLTPGKKAPQGWLLHIPTVYFGIATAAYEEALTFATHYAPNSISSGTIAQFPAVQQKVGQMRLLLLEMESFLFNTAKEWDRSTDQERYALGELLSAVKVSTVNKAIMVVDLAMRLVGARSLSRSNPLQRYYRDVRAGLHNPPMEDMVITQLAKRALNLP